MSEAKPLAQYDPMVDEGIIQWIDSSPDSDLTGTKIEPGFLYKDLPNALYHKGPGISNSGLTNIRRSPMHYKFLKENPKPSTDTLRFGQALHALVLEGEEKFYKEFFTTPDGAPKKPTAAQLNAKKPSAATIEAIKYWQAFEAENANRTFIPNVKQPEKGPVWGRSQWESLFYMRDSIREHADADILFSDGIAELTGYWVDNSISEETIRVAGGTIPALEDPTFKLCKLRLDWWNYSHNIIVDLKSTMDASFTSFAQSCVKFTYPVQDAFYCYGMECLKRPVDEFVFVAIEKEPPYAVAGYVLTEEAKDLGRQMFRRDLNTYLAAREHDYWPGYQNLDGRTIRDLELPAYAFKNRRIF